MKKKLAVWLNALTWKSDKTPRSDTSRFKLLHFTRKVSKQRGLTIVNSTVHYVECPIILLQNCVYLYVLGWHADTSTIRHVGSTKRIIKKWVIIIFTSLGFIFDSHVIKSYSSHFLSTFTEYNVTECHGKVNYDAIRCTCTQLYIDDVHSTSLTVNFQDYCSSLTAL